ncbi:aryl hydrocarbon receptor nuclear translocator-like protein 2 isoform X3 [Cottoperca gobio]|uniref:Aryl hydrocarbon receptor nuclear translocator-like protein 2 isoform X3 n=1 Tax=Cottoperca gobio TaxID=56716 RepID=A0A6J2S8Z8_COTGO|nr:aryl hydrocarbon receptor nuclear translocator-like protein 2 isoform X3 [Cottoperca gobio]
MKSIIQPHPPLCYYYRLLMQPQRLQSAGMSAGGCDAAKRPVAGTAADVDEDVAGRAVELPRKRKGEVEERQSEDLHLKDELSRSEEEDQQVKMKIFREPHRQIEKRRRDKMNTLIDELSAMIPAGKPATLKLDKLTVLRKAVLHLKTLRAGTSSVFTDTSCTPSVLSQDDLRGLLLRAADGFLLVVSCDGAKILFVSESVCRTLSFSRLDLTGQSLFDFLHPKDINKVKEQLLSSESRGPPVAGAQVQTDAPLSSHHMSSGARRSFLCRMKHSRVAEKPDHKQPLPSTPKKKDSYRHCTLHCTGYMHSWPSSQSENDADKETSSLSCLVTVCRLLPLVSHQPPTDLHTKPSEFVTRCAIDGKFTFVEQQATTVIGYLPQEVLGTSCYEYFHQDDLQHLAEKHWQVLQSKEKIETRCYKFKTKHGSHVSLQSQWFSFTNPWTKEVEFIVSLNRVVSGPGHTTHEDAGSSKALQDDTRQIPIIPGLSSGVGTMIYAGSIGTQIANKLMDSYSRMNSSPSSGASSPFGPALEKYPLVSSQTSTSASSREEAVGSSSQSDSRAAVGVSSATSESSGTVSRILSQVLSVSLYFSAKKSKKRATLTKPKSFILIKNCSSLCTADPTHPLHSAVQH